MTHKKGKQIACNKYWSPCKWSRCNNFENFISFTYLEKFNEDVILINVFHPSTILMRLAQRS